MEIRDTTVKTIMREYEKAAIQHGDAVITPDNRKANKAYDKLTRLFRRFMSDDALAEEVLGALLGNHDPRVRIWAASHSLGLKTHVAEAETVLSDISRMEGLKLLRYNAEKTLEVWKRQGYLRF